MDDRRREPSRDEPAAPSPAPEESPASRPRPACPACGGRLIEIRAKLQCARCPTICETCCEGGRG